MGVLIDASVLVDAERGRLDLTARVARRPDDDAYLSVVTASELLHGSKPPRSRTA
jgi:tRNA(fMet)-specific endonuclease VapC